jgi:hypothetical protein
MGQAFGYSQALAWIIPFFIKGLSRRYDPVTQEPYFEYVPFMFGSFMLLVLPFLYLFQAILHEIRPDPFCPSVTYYGSPSSVGFYAALLVTFFVGTTFYMAKEILVTEWVVLWFILVGPTGYMIYLSFNTFKEILFSLLLGAFTSAMFILVVCVYLRDEIPWIVNSQPVTYFGRVRDTWLSVSEEQKKLTCKIQQILEHGSHLDV